MGYGLNVAEGRQLNVVALVAAHNEADVISQVIEDLVVQGISVYLIDDGSTDATVPEASRWLNQGLIEIESRGPADTFDWLSILKRKEELTSELGADWYIHHDADEFRECPWPGMTLLEGIRVVDSLGYNAIDFRLLNFLPTGESWTVGSDVREAFQYFKPGDRWDTVQIKAWKRTGAPVDLVSSGGHEAAFEGRRVCPVPFLLRHYPLRGDAHGVRKVFSERISRFSPAERKRGWHVQYDRYLGQSSIIADVGTLTKFDRAATHEALAVSHRDSQWHAAALQEIQKTADELRLELDATERRWQQILADAKQRLDEARAEGDMVREQLRQSDARLQHEIMDKAATVARLNEEVARTRTEGIAVRERYESDISDLQRRIAELRDSLSWRLTGPLRAVYRLLFRTSAK